MVQCVMDQCRTKDWPLLCKEFYGRVWRAVEHQHANNVLQKIITAAPRRCGKFIIQECMDKAVDLAKHPYGCLIFCHIIVLVNDQTVVDLCRHSFGHHVVQRIMEKGIPDHRKRIVDEFSKDPITMARSKYASVVVEAAFNYCEVEERELKNLLLQPQTTGLCGHKPATASSKTKKKTNQHKLARFVLMELASKEEDDEGLKKNTKRAEDHPEEIQRPMKRALQEGMEENLSMQMQ